MVLIAAILTPRANGEVLYVDSTNGNDIDPGTRDKPLKTIGKAAESVNGSTEPGPTTIKVASGVYVLPETVVFENSRPYTKEKRLIIEATVLPDEPQWKPALMPVILSAEDARKPGQLDILTETYSIKVKISHVTIKGLKFFGNPLVNNWHCCVERIGEKLDDLVVSQCVFVADSDGLNIYCAALATGDRFVAEHCIFKRCGACVVFWDGPEQVGSRGCSMKYCVVDGAYMSGVWTCQTAEDFEFNHNIVINSQYLWIRKRGDRQKYKISKCVAIGNKYFSGYGIASGPTGQTSDEVTYEHVDVITKGTLAFETDRKSRNYMHVREGSVGRNFGAGLFTRRFEPSDVGQDEF